MKAEERHRLAENDLVKGLNRITTTAKRPSNMILFMIGLIVVLGFVYWYWSNTAANRVSRAWIQYYEKRSDIESAPETWKTGPAGHAVQLAIADKSFERGFGRLFLDPQQALGEFEQAAKQYEDLSKIASNKDILLRSLVGAARSYENLGNVEKAVALYDTVQNKFGTSSDWKDHPLVKDSQNHKKQLAAGENSLSILYQSWASRLKQVSTTPGLQKPPEFPNIPIPPVP